MIEVTTIAAQTVPVGGTVTFGRVVHKSGCGECFNTAIPTSVKLCAKGIYDLEFGGNITNETAALPVQVALAIEGSPIATTARSAVPAVAGDLWGVEGGTFLRNCCCDTDRISVVNTGPNPVVIAPNFTLRIARRS